MIEAFIPTSVMELSTKLTDQPLPLETTQGALWFGIAGLCTFGTVSTLLFLSTFRHKSQRDSDSPHDWQEHSPKPIHTLDRRINPGNLSSWEIRKPKTPRGPMLN